MNEPCEGFCESRFANMTAPPAQTPIVCRPVNDFVCFSKQEMAQSIRFAAACYVLVLLTASLHTVRAQKSDPVTGFNALVDVLAQLQQLLTGRSAPKGNPAAGPSKQAMPRRLLQLWEWQSY